MTEQEWDVVVVGGGPAGLSAALVLGRARRKVLVVDAGRPRNRFAGHMHGVVGHDGVSPTELLQRGREEASRYSVTFVDAQVARVEDHEVALEVMTDRDAALRCRALVIASGIDDELPDVPGLAARWGTGVLQCPYCHGWEVAGQRLGVIATSTLGLHQVQLVRQWSDRVVFFHSGAGPLDPRTRDRLTARGIELVDAAVIEVAGGGGRVREVRTADGATVAVDAIFITATPRPHDSFCDALGLARTERPFGAFLTVDPSGQTSHQWIWAAGNVADPTQNVAMAVGAGAMTAGAVNQALVNEDFDRAVLERWSARTEADSAQFWEDRYAERDQIWSGKPNQALTAAVRDLPPGGALDLGCGEGADSIWLAERGWHVTAIDIAPTAIAHAAAHAEAGGIPDDRITWLAEDLSTWVPSDAYDLVSACFLHSPLDFPRRAVLQRAAGAVAPGGHLLIVGHTAPPTQAPARLSHLHGKHRFLDPAEELAELGLDNATWDIVVREIRDRVTAGTDGQEAALRDAVILLRRREAGIRGSGS